MGRLFDTNVHRTRWLQAFEYFVTSVDTGARTPRQAIRDIANQTGLTKLEVAQEIAFRSKWIGEKVEDRLRVFLFREEV